MFRYAILDSEKRSWNLDGDWAGHRVSVLLTEGSASVETSPMESSSPDAIFLSTLRMIFPDLVCGS